MANRATIVKRSTVISAVLAALGVVLAAVFPGCQGATQARLSIRWAGDCRDLKGIEILVASAAEKVEGSATATRFAAAQTTTCGPNGEVGTLVVTPNGSSAAVMVIGGFLSTVGNCHRDNGYAGCVVARRRFSFIENVTAEIPIVLDPSCVDVPCGALSTCVEKSCVDSEIDCEDTGTCSPPGSTNPPTTTDGGEDGTAGDGGIADGPSGDGPLVDGPTTNEGGTYMNVNLPFGTCTSSLTCPINGDASTPIVTCGKNQFCCLGMYGGPTGIDQECHEDCGPYNAQCCGGARQCGPGEGCCKTYYPPDASGGPPRTYFSCVEASKCPVDITEPEPIFVCRTPGDHADCPLGYKCDGTKYNFNLYRCKAD